MTFPNPGPGHSSYGGGGGTIHLLNTLISYWKLDEVSGGPMVDSVGSNALTNYGGFTQVAGKINTAPSLDQTGGGQILILVDNTSIRVTSDFAWSCWVKNPSGAGGSGYVIAKQGATGSDYELSYTTASGNGFVFSAGSVSGSGATSSFVPAAGAWTHVVVWYDSSDGLCRIRINDATTHVGSVPATLVQTAQNLGMACDGDGNAKLGMVLDEVGFWKRKLTAAEITALYNGGAGLPFGSFTT